MNAAIKLPAYVELPEATCFQERNAMCDWVKVFPEMIEKIRLAGFELHTRGHSSGSCGVYRVFLYKAEDFGKLNLKNNPFLAVSSRGVRYRKGTWFSPKAERETMGDALHYFIKEQGL